MTICRLRLSAVGSAALLLISLSSPRQSRAQNVPPFFAAGATSFTPEIGVINSGIINDVQAVVSADQKHVTLNMRPSNSRLLALEDFTFQNGGPGLGFVGSGGNAGAGGNAVIRGGGRQQKLQTNSDYPDGRPTVLSLLDRSGMYRIDPPLTR